MRALPNRVGLPLPQAAQQRLQRQRQLCRVCDRIRPVCGPAARQPGFRRNGADPILCAGVTTYKGIKETEAKPGEWIAISGVGGLGQLAVEYAKAMGLHVVALDVTEEKLALARASGADLTVNARAPDAAAQVVKHTGGGAHGALVTAVSPAAFTQAIHMMRRKGTIALVGLPPGDFPTPIFDVVLGRITIRGSIVGGRQDLAEAIAFAAEGKVHAHTHEMKLEDINQVFLDLRAGRVDGRMVMKF